MLAFILELFGTLEAVASFSFMLWKYLVKAETAMQQSG
jgi:hypothetical protein